MAIGVPEDEGIRGLETPLKGGTPLPYEPLESLIKRLDKIDHQIDELQKERANIVKEAHWIIEYLHFVASNATDRTSAPAPDQIYLPEENKPS